MGDIASMPLYATRKHTDAQLPCGHWFHLPDPFKAPVRDVPYRCKCATDWRIDCTFDQGMVTAVARKERE